MILRYLLLLALFMISHILPVAAQNAKISLRIALPEGPDTRAIGFLIAQQRGYFADAGLEVTFLKQAYGRSPIDLLSESQVDLAVEIMPIALSRRARGADVVHVAQIFQKATLGLYCRTIIDEPAKLAGRDVGVWLDGWESPFYAWLTRLGLSYFATGGGVTIVRQGIDANAFLANETDCLTTTTYRAPFMLGPGVAQSLTGYRYQNLGLGVLEDGLYARETDLKDPARVEAFRRFLRAAKRGWQSLHNDLSEVERFVMTLPENSTLDPKAVTESLLAVLEAISNVDLGTLDETAYDRTILLLLTGAPDPLLVAAPSGAVSPIIRQAP